MGGPVVGLGQWPILRLFGSAEFASYLDEYGQAQIEARGFSAISVYQHPWEFIPMPGIHEGLEARIELTPALHEKCGPEALSALGEVVDALRGRGFAFCTMRDFHRIWEETENAS